MKCTIHNKTLKGKKGFQKGNTDGSKRGLGIKAKQWEELGESIITIHSQRFNEILEDLAENDSEKFARMFLDVLTYFKPKMSSTDLKSNQGISIKVNVPNEES